MATKAKPKSNRAKFTIQKKAEKPKVEKESSKKEVKVVKEAPSVEETPHEEVIAKPVVHTKELKQPIPEPVEVKAHESVAGSSEESDEAASVVPPVSFQSPDLPVNPFSVNLPVTPEAATPEVHSLSDVVVPPAEVVPDQSALDSAQSNPL